MLEFTNDQVKQYLLGVIIFTLFYMIIYHMKGTRKNVRGYIDAIKSCFIYAVSFIFFIVGIGLVKQFIVEKMYMGLLIPLGWLVIIYLLLRQCLKTDFDIDISIFRLDPIKKRLLFDVIIRGIIALGFALASIMIFVVAVPDVENQPYGPIPLVIAGILFGGVALLLIRSILFKLYKR